MAILPKRRIKNPATQQEIDTSNRNALKIGSYLGATLIPFPVKLLSKVVGPAIATRARQLGDSIRFTKGMTTSGVSSAVKKAGSIGNTKKPDTVGNRLKSGEAILGKSATELIRTGKGIRNRRTLEKGRIKGKAQYIPVGGPELMYLSPQRFAPTFSARKTDRTLMSAVKQGPSKFFSIGRSAKTGITAGKRSRGGLSNKQMKKERDVYGMRVGISRDLPVFANKSLLKQILKDNQKARDALRKK